MHLKDVSKFVGQVVLLELINGERVCTRIESVEQDLNYIVTKQLISFVMIPNPEHPDQARMMPVPYGAPLYDLGKSAHIDLAHILFAITPPGGMEEAYVKMTTGLSIQKPSLIIPS